MQKIGFFFEVQDLILYLDWHKHIANKFIIWSLSAECRAQEFDQTRPDRLMLEQKAKSKLD
jgi:hypothetical protein